MPRRTIVGDENDEDDAVPLNDLLRTGEASRLRRRGALRATAHRRDDDDVASFKPDQSFLELECGVLSSEFSFASAGPSSQPSPLPLPSLAPRKPVDVGFVFPSSGCSAVVTTRAVPSPSGYPVFSASEFVNADVAPLPSEYLEPEQRVLADALIDGVWGKCKWEAVGCRICGNALGFRYAPCHTSTQPVYIFFPSAVTPSPNYAFPAHPDSDTTSLSPDSPTFSPRVTRYFHHDDEFWPSEINPPVWTPDHQYIPTPPRSLPTAAALARLITSDAQETDTTVQPTDFTYPMPSDPNVPAPDGVHTSEGVYTPDDVLAANGFEQWTSFIRTVSPSPFTRDEEPPHNESITTAAHVDLITPGAGQHVSPHLTPPPPPSHPNPSPTNPILNSNPWTQPTTHRPTAHRPTAHRPTAPTAPAPAPAPAPGPTSAAAPSHHRVPFPRRPIPPTTRRPPSLDWSTRTRHSPSLGHPAHGDSNGARHGDSNGGGGGEERFTRGMGRAGRRMTIPVVAPGVVQTMGSGVGDRGVFTAEGERAQLDGDMRDDAGAGVGDVEVERPERTPRESALRGIEGVGSLDPALIPDLEADVGAEGESESESDSVGASGNESESAGEEEKEEEDVDVDMDMDERMAHRRRARTRVRTRARAEPRPNTGRSAGLVAT